MNDSPPDALQRLILARMRELRRSYGDVARLGKLPRSTVHHLATHRHSGRLPAPATLERLAAGLDLPLNVVRAAAAAAGLVLDTAATDDPETDVLIASLARLSPADRRHVAVLICHSSDGEPQASRGRAAAPTRHGHGTSHPPASPRPRCATQGPSPGRSRVAAGTAT